MEADMIQYLRAHTARARGSSKTKLNKCITAWKADNEAASTANNLRTKLDEITAELKRVWDDAGKPNALCNSPFDTRTNYFLAGETPRRLLHAIAEARETRDTAIARQERLEQCINALYREVGDDMRTTIRVLASVEGITLDLGVDDGPMAR